MKRIMSLVVSVATAFALTGCGNGGTATTTTATAETTGEAPSESATRIALVVPNIGDQSYFDVTYNGLQLLKDKYGSEVDTNLIEMGTDSGGWETAYRQAAEDGYDIIISGNFMYEAYMLKVAAEYPEIQFLNFDYSDAEANALDNVYAIGYASNEAGYLAGVVAAVKSKSGIVGCIGGMEIDGIKDFLVGFLQGAYDVNPDIQCITGFIGDFTDTAKAKEIALNMYNQGADVIYHAAGGAGNGLFEAAAEKGFWAIGVDSDQYATFLNEKPELAAQILTSAEKKCDQGILVAIGQILDGSAAFGTAQILHYKDGAVGLSENENYKANMTAEEQAAVKEYADKVLSGETTVVSQLTDPTAFDTYVELTK